MFSGVITSYSIHYTKLYDESDVLEFGRFVHDVFGEVSARAFGYDMPLHMTLVRGRKFNAIRSLFSRIDIKRRNFTFSGPCDPVVGAWRVLLGAASDN